MFVCVQTLMNVASPATCVSISVSTALGVTLVSVQRDINSRDSGYVKVRLLREKKQNKTSRPLKPFRSHPVAVEPVKTGNEASLGQSRDRKNARGEATQPLTLCIATSKVTSVGLCARWRFLEVDFFLKLRGAPSKGELLTPPPPPSFPFGQVQPLPGGKP